MIPGVNYAIYGCSSARKTPGVSLYRSLTLEEKAEFCVLVDCYY